MKQVEIVPSSTGGIQRQEEPVLGGLGINTSNLAIQNLDYSEKVKAQIAEQQSMTMAVQTSMAEAKKAEQNYITITKNGEAAAAKAKWEKEELKASLVTEAEARRQVAELDVKTAVLRKEEKIHQATGEGEFRRRMMVSDGALSLKLEAWKFSQEKWAAAWGTNGANIVPYLQSGGSGSGSGNNGSALNSFLELQALQAAKQIGLEMNMNRGTKTQQ